MIPEACSPQKLLSAIQSVTGELDILGSEKQKHAKWSKGKFQLSVGDVVSVTKREAYLSCTWLLFNQASQREAFLSFHVASLPQLA